MRSTWRMVLAFVVGAAIATSGFMQVALAQDASESPSATGEKVTFTYGSTGEPSSLNPMSGYLAVDFYFWTASYHLLIDWDQNLGLDDNWGSPGAGLVTDIQASDDKMSYTYTIRDDIVWSDGTPLTAEDVAFTLNLYKQNHAYLPQTYLELISGDVTFDNDANTITFQTKVPTGLYSGNSAYMYDYILPAHVWSDTSIIGDKPKQFENVPNVGSGPFVISEYQVGEFVRMEKNPYWTGPDPAVDEIIYRIYKNEDALSEALKVGDVDFAYFTSFTIFDALGTQPNVDTMAGTIPSFSEIGLNSGSAYQPKTDYYTPHGDGHPALTDVTVRRAIRMAIDSKTLTDRVLGGYGLPGDTIVPPTSVEGAKWTPEGDDLLAFDPEAANKLLDDAGYVDTDNDGVREMPPGSLDPGRPLEFRYFVRSNEQTSVDASQFVKPWLADIGIKANVQVVTSGRLGDIINEGTYDMFSWGWIPDPDPDSMLSNMTCEQRPPDGSTYGNNDAYWCNEEYDKLLEQQRAETDPAKRWDIVHEMQKMFYEDAAYSVMWYDPVFSAWRTDRFTGYVVQPEPKGDPLEGWGGPSSVWWTLKPVGATTGTTETRGISPIVWVLIGVGIVIVVAAIVLLGRRRRAAEDEA